MNPFGRVWYIVLSMEREENHRGFAAVVFFFANKLRCKNELYINAITIKNTLEFISCFF